MAQGTVDLQIHFWVVVCFTPARGHPWWVISGFHQNCFIVGNSLQHGIEV